MTTITIIDYGVGNFRNVQKAFEYVGATAHISDAIADIETAQALVLPGVGAFGDAMNNIRRRDFESPILAAVKAGKPMMGICVGLQLLFDESEEMGRHQGLGILPGKICRFRHGLTVPHMGWNQIEPERNHALLRGIDPGDFAYFAHSFYADPTRTEDVIARTEYGHRYPSIVGRDNVCAIQFHPEKSQHAGLQILKNFVDFADELR